MLVGKSLRLAVSAGLFGAGLCALALLQMPLSRAEDANKRIEAAEAKRIAVIDKIKPSVVAIFAPGGQGGGSGVVISQDGYALTNFHV
ncbi:MAG TPA: hypothetical protein VG099_14960, partial [Gemmataceae bacterium]|nr:hypothetical protein [Gemmataceae bacterium]